MAVARRGDHLGVKVDNHYTLGSTRGHGLQQRQAHFTVLLHPEPRRVFAERLARDGLFAQWLPLYQLTQQEFGVIARTFTTVFPEVTLWRGDFLPEGPIIALVGRIQAVPLDASSGCRMVDSAAVAAEGWI